MNKVLVEIVCCSVDDCLEALHGGADRIELCAALPLGGLTPSLGLFLEARERFEIPVMAMVRPRGSGMAYSEGEFQNMLRDAEIFAEHNAEGLVFGFLTPEGTIDTVRCRRLLNYAGAAQTVFHRAFDVTPDPFEALEQLIDLGFTRVLTSGQRPSALDGVDLIKALIDKADGRIEVLPGAGLRSDSIGDFVARTGCVQVHLAPFGVRIDSSTQHNTAIRYGAGEMPDDSNYGLISRDEVAAVVKAFA